MKRVLLAIVSMTLFITAISAKRQKNGIFYEHFNCLKAAQKTYSHDYSLLNLGDKNSDLAIPLIGFFEGKLGLFIFFDEGASFYEGPMASNDERIIYQVKFEKENKNIFSQGQKYTRFIGREKINHNIKKSKLKLIRKNVFVPEVIYQFERRLWSQISSILKNNSAGLLTEEESCKVLKSCKDIEHLGVAPFTQSLGRQITKAISSGNCL